MRLCPQWSSVCVTVSRSIALFTAHYTQAVCVGFRLSSGELECAAGRRTEALPWCLPNRKCSANIYRANAYLHEIVTRVVLQTHDWIPALQTNIWIPRNCAEPRKNEGPPAGRPFSLLLEHFWYESSLKGWGDSVLSVCLKQVTLTGDLPIGSCILEYGRSRPCSAVINNLKNWELHIRAPS